MRSWLVLVTKTYVRVAIDLIGKLSNRMNVNTSLPVGQQQARIHWGTEASGAAFDRKKTPYLTEQAQTFITQQAFCVIAGLGPEYELCGMLAMGKPGFVEVVDSHTCLIYLEKRNVQTRLTQKIEQSACAELGLFFICHTTRERLCVQGIAVPLPAYNITLNCSTRHSDVLCLCLHVRQAFFHCAKYIRTQVSGLTAPVAVPFGQKWQPQQLRGYKQPYLSEEVCAFIAQQVLCFLCTVNQDGHCAVNHRGGAPGFLIPIPPTSTSPGGTILLPDYSGNGAFEAIGNILETGQTTLVIPHYAAQLALCVSGEAQVIEMAELPKEVAESLPAAERVVMLLVLHVETQFGDWSDTLAYERARAESFVATKEPDACSLRLHLY